MLLVAPELGGWLTLSTLPSPPAAAWDATPSVTLSPPLSLPPPLSRRHRPPADFRMPVTVVKPAWVLHPDDKERATTIYTLAIHPDGSRLATGGLDTKIRIWSTAPIVDEAMEKNEKVPKLLCTMTSHSGSSFSPLD